MNITVVPWVIIRDRHVILSIPVEVVRRVIPARRLVLVVLCEEQVFGDGVYVPPFVLRISSRSRSL